MRKLAIGAVGALAIFIAAPAIAVAQGAVPPDPAAGAMPSSSDPAASSTTSGSYGGNASADATTPSDTGSTQPAKHGKRGKHKSSSQGSTGSGSGSGTSTTGSMTPGTP